MIGAIAGDIIGSIYEFNNIKTTDFPLFAKGCTFTDDSVLTIALADSIMNNVNYETKLKEYYRLYPNAGYGGSFSNWVCYDRHAPYNSWGNGAAMRISPAGYAYGSLEETLLNARKFTMVTHDHPEGIKGACATAAAIYMARTGSTKLEIKEYIESTYGYDLHRSIDQIRPGYTYDVSCQGTVPESIIAFLESQNFEDAIRLAVSLGGDCDTLTCITGGIAQAFYGGVPNAIIDSVYSILDERLGGVTRSFLQRYNPK